MADESNLPVIAGTGRDKLLDVEAFARGAQSWVTNLMHGGAQDRELLMRAKGTAKDYVYLDTSGNGNQIDADWHPIRGYLMHKISKVDGQTGEAIEFPRLALVIDGDKVLELFPRFAVQDLLFAVLCYGPGPWDDIDVQVARVKGNYPLPACRLNFRERPKVAAARGKK